jgi:hypothetical protein
MSELEPPPTDLITLTRHILSQQAGLGERASGDLTLLLIGIQVSWLVLPNAQKGFASFGAPRGPGQLDVWLSTG